MADDIKSPAELRDDAEVAKLRAETDKLRAEIAAVDATRQAAWVRTVTVALGVLALCLSAGKGILELSQIADSMRLADAAEVRQHNAMVSESEARMAASRLGQEAETRLKNASSAEIDVRILTSYLNDVLPRLSGATGYQLSQTCMERLLAAGVDPNAAGSRCSGPVPFPRGAQVGAYSAAIDMATRYPVLCRATRAVLLHQSEDPDAQAALRGLPTCTSMPIGAGINAATQVPTP